MIQDRPKFLSLASLPISDVKAVALGNGKIYLALVTGPFLDVRVMSISSQSEVAVALPGSQGRLRVYDANSYLTGPCTIDIGGPSIPSSKGTLEILNDWVFAATGDGGAKIVSISGRRVIGSLARPVEADVDPADAVSNAVTVDGDLVFVANGGAGVYVASKQGNGTGMNPNLTLLGKIRFPGRVSANYVASEGGMIFVAAGLGGLKIIRVN